MGQQNISNEKIIETLEQLNANQKKIIGDYNEGLSALFGIKLHSFILFEHFKVRFLEKYGIILQMPWIPVSTGVLPPYENEVIVARPNQYSGKTDILLGYLHKARPEGQSYGRLGEEGTTFKDYWSLPSIQTFEKITHWMPKPIEPGNETASEIKAIMIQWIMGLTDKELLDNFQNKLPQLQKFFQ